MTPDAIGYVASSLVFAAYCMKEMISLRIVAICSNVAFIVYGLSLGLAPVWVLHAALLPLNGWRLAQAIACQRKAGTIGLGPGQRRPCHRINPYPSDHSVRPVNGTRNPSDKFATGSGSFR
jgi:hypothetical protein